MRQFFPSRMALSSILNPLTKAVREIIEMSTKHKHDHESEARVDLKKKRIYLDGETYRWEDVPNQGQFWDRASKTKCKKDGKIVDFVPKEKRSKKYTWEKAWRDLHSDTKKNNDRLIRRLDALVEKAEARKAKQLQKAVLAFDHANDLPDEDSSSGSAEETPVKLTPWQKREKQGPPAKGKRIERTKYGVRVYSNDQKTYWDICVNNSTTYRGTAVRMTLPPPRKDGKRWTMAVFDLEAMEAIRREFARGEEAKKQKAG